MKIQIDVVTGFLDSGKTTYINQTLRDYSISGKKTVVLQFEYGEIDVDNRLTENIIIEKLNKGKQFDCEYIKEIIKKYNPQRIIIEYNGMKPINALFEVFEERTVRKRCSINYIVNTIDAATFEIFMNNMGSMFIEQISNSDIIVLNKTDGISIDKLDSIKKTIKTLNVSADIVNKSQEKKLEKIKSEDKFLFVILSMVAIYFIIAILRGVDFVSIESDLSWMKTFNTVFLSILMQAFPFILIGVFVSSFLQVCISDETFVRIFPRKMGFGFIVAILAGFLFPVCDCAIVPVASRLIKKGVPVPVAITFMLSAPLVNPVVIASTLYAFQGQPYIALLRVSTGIAIAIAVGISFIFFPEEKSIIKSGSDKLSCGCEYCNGDMQKRKGLSGKFGMIFNHAGAEFFQVGKYVIAGAFLSSIFQVAVPKDIFNNLFGRNVVALIVMMLAAFVFSVCSTSDAFIARTFTNQFPTGAIMGFLILGPMIDIKNMLMLLSSFRKGFVIKLVLFIFTFAFVLLYFQMLMLSFFM